MKKEEIYLGDWQRFLIGNAPWEFMIEVFFRTLIIYLILIVVLRLLGKRMSAQMTISELAVMVTLGAVVSVPMQVPDRGLLPGIVALLCALLFQRGLTWLNFKYRKAELIAQGDLSLLIADGCLQLEEMEKASASREQIFAQLRCKNVQHLGQVKRLYLEASGQFSLFKNDDPKPGLSILPEQDEDLLREQPASEDYFACTNCGKIDKTYSKPAKKCERCGGHRWLPALNLLPVTAK